MPHHTKKGPAFLLVLSCAVGETRTRTGLRPLPPQSSVSTISPPPLEFGIAKVRQKSELPNFSEKFFSFFVKISRLPPVARNDMKEVNRSDTEEFTMNDMEEIDRNDMEGSIQNEEVIGKLRIIFYLCTLFLG